MPETKIEVPTYGNWIAGEWADDGELDEIVDPFSGDVVGCVPLATDDDLERAIGAAEDAFEATREQSSFERSRQLAAIARDLLG